jgi:glycosyltransferase involved in cell wall biosynthesis
MYLPSGVDRDDSIKGTPVFYGAINVYLKEKLPFYRHAPVWLERVFDSSALLNLAARASSSTQATGHEEMTLSMLRGEMGRQSSELDHLIQYLERETKPDVVHLSNALLLGLAHRLKNDLGSAVVCSLQDENEWIDLMPAHYQEQVWNLMSERATDVDLFVTSSQFYAEKSQKRLKIPGDKIDVVHGGLCLEGYQQSPLPLDPPVLGYMCRMSEYFGLGILVDAFIKVKQNHGFRDLRLQLTGGYTHNDKPFVNRQLKTLSKLGMADDVRVFDSFDRESRIQFLSGLTLLSVPVPTGEAFGAYQVESLAAGVPIVQPNIGCYPEFIEETKGGIIYDPNTGERLAEVIASLLENPDRIRQLGTQGLHVVRERFTMEYMAKNMAGLYQHVA